MDKKEAQKLMKKLPILTFSIIFISMISFLSPEIASVLIFDREAILNGEIWRLFSSHCVHLTINHLIYNLFAFVITGWIVERKSYYQLLFLYILMAFVICMTLLLFKPDMIYYGGLSGIACGLIYYSALLKMEEERWRIICQCITIFLPVKIAIELYSNASVLPYWGHQPFVIMPVSHVMGIATALFFYFGVKYIQSCSRRRFDIDHQPVA
jgi:rhomboid family GlyGly-CTERM serine protease